MKALTGGAFVIAVLLVAAACTDNLAQPTPRSSAPSPIPSRTPAVAPGDKTAAPSVSPSRSPAVTSGPASSAPSPAPSHSPAVTSGPASTTPRLIELVLNAELQIVRDGQPIDEIRIAPGETVRFRVTNTAGYAHNFLIGTDRALSANATADLVGITDFVQGTQEFLWTVPDDITGLRFGSTVPGQYLAGMQGAFSPAVTSGPASSAPSVSHATDGAVRDINAASIVRASDASRE